jgi:hypothetical protein
MSNEGTQAQVPLDVLRLLAPAAEQLGIDLPGFTRLAPMLDLSKDIRALAHELGMMLKGRDLFLFAEEKIVSVDAASGKMKEMTAKRFVGWVEEYVAFRAPATSRRTRNSLTKEEAEILLGQDIFCEQLRPLRAVNLMRLPVRRRPCEEQPLGRVEWLPPGYDAESQIFTCDVLKYAMDWPFERGLEWLVEVCSEVPWNDIDDPERCGGNLLKNRSFAVHFLAMMGAYCHGMFPPGTLRPIISYFGNKPGAGKTTLVAMSQAMVHGDVGATVAPKDEDKLALKLESVAASLLPYVLLDDLAGGLKSQALNNFITARRHHLRVYHTQRVDSFPQVTQVFVTGNELQTSEDIGRRSLLANLWLDVEVAGRKFKRVLSGEWLAQPEVRAKFLAACCAVLRQWLALGQFVPEKELRHPAPMASFESFTGVLGGIVLSAGLCDPLAEPETVAGGSTRKEEMKMLLCAAAQAREGDCNVTREELVDLARELGLLEFLVGAKGDGKLDEGGTKRFGAAMRRWRGEKLTDGRGRLFRFGHKKKNSGAVYPLEFLTVAPVPPKAV